MEREFKFRCWNPRYKEFSTWGFMPDGHFKGIPTGSHMSIDECKTYSQMFTGLKDKNGKEIYEDDVVKDPGGNCLRVIWNQDACEYQLDHEDGMHSLTIECTEWAEVIGNVFQNPELINKATS